MSGCSVGRVKEWEVVFVVCEGDEYGLPLPLTCTVDAASQTTTPWDLSLVCDDFDRLPRLDLKPTETQASLAGSVAARR